VPGTFSKILEPGEYNKILHDLALLGREAYVDGKNIIGTITNKSDRFRDAALEISYNLQSGVYTDLSTLEEVVRFRDETHGLIRNYLEEFEIDELLDLGVGEGTSWIDCNVPVNHFIGFDLSLNRLDFVRTNLKKTRFGHIDTVRGNLSNLPFFSDSIDAITTMHSIEANTKDSIEKIVSEIVRVARKFLFIFEPNYETANNEMKNRMRHHGYATNIFATVRKSSCLEILCEGQLSDSTNKKNLTSYIFARKKGNTPKPKSFLRSPLSELPLIERDNFLAEQDGCFVFPIVGETKCLCAEDGIMKFFKRY
jgi:hypothetical protein